MTVTVTRVEDRIRFKSQPTSYVILCECNFVILRFHYGNKASGGDGIPVELFQILKDDAVKVLHSICQQIWKTQKWPQDWKTSVFIPIPKKGNAKECSNYLISYTRKRSTSRLNIVTLLIQLNMQSTSLEMLGWRKHKLESRLLGEISITLDMQMTPPLWQTLKKN